MKSTRLTVRLQPCQMQVLKEMREKMGVSCSLIVRTIILDFLERNGDRLENIMYNKENGEEEEEEYAEDQFATEEEEGL